MICTSCGGPTRTDYNHAVNDDCLHFLRAERDRLRQVIQTALTFIQHIGLEGAIPENLSTALSDKDAG